MHGLHCRRWCSPTWCSAWWSIPGCRDAGLGVRHQRRAHRVDRLRPGRAAGSAGRPAVASRLHAGIGSHRGALTWRCGQRFLRPTSSCAGGSTAIRGLRHPRAAVDRGPALLEHDARQGARVLLRRPGRGSAQPARARPQLRVIAARPRSPSRASRWRSRRSPPSCACPTCSRGACGKSGGGPARHCATDPRLGQLATLVGHLRSRADGTSSGPGRNRRRGVARAQAEAVRPGSFASGSRSPNLAAYDHYLVRGSSTAARIPTGMRRGLASSRRSPWIRDTRPRMWSRRGGGLVADYARPRRECGAQTGGHRRG